MLFIMWVILKPDEIGRRNFRYLLKLIREIRGLVFNMDIQKMCRLLYVRSKTLFQINDHLQKFAQIAKNSKEFQGHGWGCAFLRDGDWNIYKNINPIWKDDLHIFGTSNQLIAHARSAFKDQDLQLENNMPFFNGDYIFVFNGELHGVKIKESGKIGAEKIFNYIMRFNKGNLEEAMQRGIDNITSVVR